MGAEERGGLWGWRRSGRRHRQIHAGRDTGARCPEACGGARARVCVCVCVCVCVYLGAEMYVSVCGAVY
jgi:hypothetical protein